MKLERELRNILTNKPKKLAIAVAARGFLRALGHSAWDDDITDSSLLRVLRSALIAPISVSDDGTEKLGTIYNEISGITYMALSSVDQPFDSLSSALANDACSTIIFEPTEAFASTIADISEAGNIAIGIDLSVWEGGGTIREIIQAPLWHDEPLEMGAPRQKIFDRFNQHHASYENPWSFWADWYQGFLDGKPLDWELQRRVALIPDADWDQGPAHIAAKIDEIKTAFLAEKLPLAETVALNPDTGLFHVVPIPVQNAPLIGALLSRVLDAVDDAVQGNNGLRADSREVRVLTRAAQRYGNDPQRLEMDFTSVALGLRRQIHDSHELPDSEDNLALLEAVEEGARGVRAAHPEVAANRATLAAQSLRELSPAQKAELAEALPVLQAISEGTMAEDFAADIPALINDTLLPLPTGAPRLPGMDASARVFSRAAKISIWVKTSEYVHKVDGHAAYKAARIATTLAGLVTIGLAIYGVL